MKFTKQIQLLLVGLLLLPAQLSIGQTGWRSFQNGGQSLDNENKLPLKWEPESVVWKATLAGYGQSSPVVYERNDVCHCDWFEIQTASQKRIVGERTVK